jgi:transaldolase
MPEKTLLAFRDHGSPEPRLDSGLEHARALFDQLERVGVDYDDVTQALEREGVEKFIASYSQAVESLREKLASPAAA